MDTTIGTPTIGAPEMNIAETRTPVGYDSSVEIPGSTEGSFFTQEDNFVSEEPTIAKTGEEAAKVLTNVAVKEGPDITFTLLANADLNASTVKNALDQPDSHQKDESNVEIETTDERVGSSQKNSSEEVEVFSHKNSQEPELRAMTQMNAENFASYLQGKSLTELVMLKKLLDEELKKRQPEDKEEIDILKILLWIVNGALEVASSALGSSEIE